jgi:GNAT superfamily N-acetyltransferase
VRGGEHHPVGLEYLALVTELLQNARLASPSGGIWEAADLQWWWRRDQHRDPSGATFWMVDDDPVAAAVFTDWGDRWGLDVVSARHDSAAALDAVWDGALDAIAARSDRPIETAVRLDDAAMIGALVSAGFTPTDELSVATAMAAADRPVPRPFPPGFELRAWSDGPPRPHPLVGRSGEGVADHLRACSLYSPALDLAVVDTATGAVAAYALFWPDPVTGVGLVEPMRTEEQYQGLGLARSLLEHGIDRMAAHGSTHLKVTYIDGNDAARRLYLGSGFRAASDDRTYRHP